MEVMIIVYTLPRSKILCQLVRLAVQPSSVCFGATDHMIQVLSVFDFHVYLARRSYLVMIGMPYRITSCQ
jgi:hypothetical protein